MNRCVRRSCLMLVLLTLMAADVARAQQQAASARSDPADSAVGLSPTLFWFAASTTIISASLGGFYALRVRDLYDRAESLARVSPERLELRDRMQTAELTADVLFASALVLAAGTTVLAFHIDWSGARSTTARARRSQAESRWRITPVVLPGAQSLQLQGTLP
jgi:hypothetical protein